MAVRGERVERTWLPESRIVEMPANKHVVSAKRSGAEMEHERTEKD